MRPFEASLAFGMSTEVREKKAYREPSFCRGFEVGLRSPVCGPSATPCDSWATTVGCDAWSKLCAKLCPHSDRGHESSCGAVCAEWAELVKSAASLLITIPAAASLNVPWPRNAQRA